MLRLNVFIRTSDTNREEAIKTARDLVAASLKDAGCVDYDLYQSATRENVLMICETWADPAALSTHQRSAHYTSLVPRLQQLGELKVEKFQF